MLQGHIIRLSEEGGEIRALERDETINFGSDDCASNTTFARLTCKCEVSYAVAASVSGSHVAKDVKLLPPGEHLCVWSAMRLSTMCKMSLGMHSQFVCCHETGDQLLT